MTTQFEAYTAAKRPWVRGSAAEKIKRFTVVDPDTGCHVWQRWRDRKGYGWVFADGVERSVHRVAYELAKGPIPAGLVIDHLCRNTACCNPEHLEAVTFRENVLRGQSACAQHARKTHCKRGHEFTPENTRIDKRGGRCCRACANYHAKRYYAQKHQGGANDHL